jgi:hypothetical protein
MCWITTATDTDYIILIAFHSKNVYTKAPQCEVCTCIACLGDTQARRTQISRRNKCVFEPKHFRHVNVVQDCSNILIFVIT